MSALVGILLGVAFVSPFVLVYFLFIRFCDRFEPEPWWLLITAFVWGAIFATLAGGTVSSIAADAVSASTGVSESSPAGEFLGAVVFAPIFEEGFKGLGVAIIAIASWLGLRELDGPLDGAIYGGVVGLGFTLTEDTLYVGQQYASEGVGGFLSLLVLRTVCLGLSHCTFTACTGLGFGIATTSRNWGVKIFAPFLGFGCAVGMHAFHNFLPTVFGGEGTVVMILVSWIINILFFVMIGILVTRDRAIVVRELTGEVGGLLHPRELQLVTTYFAIGRRNLATLLASGWGAFSARRKKQLALVHLAFLKSRRRRGEQGKPLDLEEARLRQEIWIANRNGIWLGS